MRVDTVVTSISWVPTESLSGGLRAGMDAGVTHWDDPPPDRITGPDEVRALCAADRFRFANVLSVWTEVENGVVVDGGYAASSGLVIGATTVRIGPIGARFQAAPLPALRRRPELGPDGAVFRQTAGGRTAAPLPRPVPHPPFLQWQAPLVWTTLQVEVRPDGSHEVTMPGASAFPRHWVYGGDGRMSLKSGLTDQADWVAHSFGARTPWGSSDREALVVAGESDLERLLSTGIMRAEPPPEIRQLAAGEVLAREGERATQLFLLLDGVVEVDVGGVGVVGRFGPGAVLGEHALLGDGVRTASAVARTPVRVAVASGAGVDVERPRALAEGRHHEDVLAPQPD